MVLVLNQIEIKAAIVEYLRARGLIPQDVFWRVDGQAMDSALQVHVAIETPEPTGPPGGPFR